MLLLLLLLPLPLLLLLLPPATSAPRLPSCLNKARAKALVLTSWV
jgi:hypothetical protein